MRPVAGWLPAVAGGSTDFGLIQKPPSRRQSFSLARAMNVNLDPLASVFAALVVLLIGTLVNRRISFLSRYNIPDPITGGLLFAVVASIIWAAAGFKAQIDQTIKPVLLLMFFAGVGMCADLRMLRHGGKALVVFLIILFPYILVQDLVGVACAYLLDLHPIFGLVAGSITLVGGHGTGAADAEGLAEGQNWEAGRG